MSGFGTFYFGGKVSWRSGGGPHEVASLAAWLAGPDASYVTGQCFVIGGGLEMNWGQGA